MASVEKINKSAERLAETNPDAAHAVVDGLVGIQERNVRFAQGIVEATTRELREQSESNVVVAQKLVERAENQRGAFQTVIEESVDAYIDLLFAPFSYYKQGLETVKKAS